MNDVVKEVTVNRNTIVVVAQFTTIRDDVPLFADGLEVHPLVFNAEDRLHYSMIWLEPQQTIHKLEAKGTDAMATGSWSPLPTPDQKPTRTNTFVVSPQGDGAEFTAARPGNLLEAIKKAIALGDSEIVLQDGLYKVGNGLPAEYMAVVQPHDGQSLRGISLVAETPRGAIISNLLDDDQFTAVAVDEEAGLYTIEGAPRPLYQLHAIVNEKVERIQERITAGKPWTEESLKASPIGGWFIHSVTDQLFVKLPDKSTPAGKLKIANPNNQKALHFANVTDLWIEGIVFEYWLKRPQANDARLGSSLIFENCTQIVVRDCESRYTIDYAFHFARCNDYLVENCDFLDGQTYTTYIAMRTGLARFGGTIRNYNSTLGTIRHNRWRQCFVVNQITSSRRFEVFSLGDEATRHIEFHHNKLYQARNHPLLMVGSGGSHAIWANVFDTCGQAMPNVEQGSPLSPVYWINNLAINAGYFGIFLEDGTDREIKANRFGGIRSPRIGQYFFYYNTLRNEWYPPNGEGKAFIRRINAWQAGSKDHSGSRYYNNIFTSIFAEIGVNTANARAIWFHEETDVDKQHGLPFVNLCRMKWDCNQYFWNKTDANGNPTDAAAFSIGIRPYTYQSLHTWVNDTLGQSWEPNGAFLDPDFDDDSHPVQTVAAKPIPGVTDNAVLGNPGSVSGATINM